MHDVFGIHDDHFDFLRGNICITWSKHVSASYCSSRTWKQRPTAPPMTKLEVSSANFDPYRYGIEDFYETFDDSGIVFHLFLRGVLEYSIELFS